jgi:uncharacterized protein
MLVWFVFNTVLAEELLCYHLHVPWVIPGTLLVDTFAVAYPAKRYRSAWIGIAAHSAQSVVLGVLIFTLVV